MEKRNKKFGLIIWNCFQILIIMYVILVTAFILCKNSFGFTQFGKFVFVTINESNSKYIEDSELGELLIIKEDSEVKKGDAIYYYSAVNEKYVVKSSFVKNIVDKEDSKVFILDDERETNVFSNRLIGTTVSSYSKYGEILDILGSSAGFLFFVLLPIMLIFVYQIYELIIIMKKEKKILKFVDDSFVDDKKVKVIEDNLEIVEAIINPDDDVEII